MRIITPPLVVEENDAFENDVLDRKDFGEALLNLVDRSSDELVISLDGKWGEGKSTFVKMWQGLLSESNIPNVYIDAFANDYIDDAFISVASAITSYYEKNIDKSKEQKLADFKETTKKVGCQLLTWTAKVGVKAATLGAIKSSDLEELKDIKSDLAKGTSGVIGEVIGERLNSHSEDVAMIQSFRETLSEMPSRLNDNDEDKPLVIIIDELDRCKPSFAVEMIEKIKHLFSVKNIVFVLVMHKEQLEEAVRCVYGQNIDAHTYLQKFINVETKIPKRKESHYGSDLQKYSRKLFELHELETGETDRLILDCLDLLANHFDLSLRQLEKTFTNLAIFYGSSSDNQLKVVPIIVFLSLIKVINQDLFNRLLHKKISYEDLCKETGLTEQIIGENRNPIRLQFIMRWLRFSLLSQQEYQQVDERDEIKNMGSRLFDYNLEREGLVSFFAQKLNLFVIN